MVCRGYTGFRVEGFPKSGVYRGYIWFRVWGSGFPQIMGTILGVSIIRVTVFGGLYCGFP